MNSRNLIPLLGLATLLAWSTISLTAQTALPLIAFNGGLIVGLAVVGLLRISKQDPFTVLAAGLLACCGVIGSFIPFPVHGLLLDLNLAYLLPCFLVGLGQAILYANWFDVYRGYQPKKALCLMLAAFGASALMRAGLTVLLGVVGFSVLFISLGLLMVSINLLMRAKLASAASKEEPFLNQKGEESSGVSFFGEALQAPPSFRFWRILLELALCGLVFGMLYSDSMRWSFGTGALTIGLVAQAFISFVILWWFMARLTEKTRLVLFRISLIGLCLGAIYAVFPFGSNEVALVASVVCLRMVMLVIMNVRLYAAAHSSQSQRSPLSLYCLGRAVFGFAELVGNLSRFAFDDVLGFGFPKELALLAIACIFLLLLNALLRRAMASSLFVSADKQQLLPSLKEKYAQFASDYELTKREMEVMILICGSSPQCVDQFEMK